MSDGVEMYLRSFRLPTMARLTEEVMAKAEAEDWGYRRFLTFLCEAEYQERQHRRIERFLAESNLPPDKTLANLEEKRFPVAIRRLLPTLLEGSFVDRAENVLAFGLPGRGKTHLLAALGRELVTQHQRRVLFVRTDMLVERLLRARTDLKLEEELHRLDRYAAIIVDELGYVEQRREQMEVFFQFVSACHERRSLLISSNLVFSQWDRIFKDTMTSMATIERLTQRSHLLQFTNERFGGKLPRQTPEKEPANDSSEVKG
jgi:DNA replication protein DnaC